MPTVGPATATTVYVPPAPAAARHEMLEAETQETLAHADAPVSTAMALSAKFSPSSVSDTPPVFGAFLGAMCVTSGAAGRPSETSQSTFVRTDRRACACNKGVRACACKAHAPSKLSNGSAVPTALLTVRITTPLPAEAGGGVRHCTDVPAVQMVVVHSALAIAAVAVRSTAPNPTPKRLRAAPP